MTSIKHGLGCYLAPAFATLTFAQDFEPKYVGGFASAETAEQVFEEYDH